MIYCNDAAGHPTFIAYRQATSTYLLIKKRKKVSRYIQTRFGRGPHAVRRWSRTCCVRHPDAERRSSYQCWTLAPTYTPPSRSRPRSNHNLRSHRYLWASPSSCASTSPRTRRSRHLCNQFHFISYLLSSVQSDVTELNWHGLVFDKLASVQTGRAHWSLVGAYVSVVT